MKKVIIAALAIAAFSAAYADVIYWMVSDEAYEDTRNTNENATDPYAWVVATDGTSVYSLKGDGKTAAQVGTAYDYSTYFTTDLGSYAGDGWSYYVELWNGTRSASEEYDTLLSNGYISRSGSIATPTTLASGGFGQAPGHNTYNVPEPTSGLLFLVGGMLLGLRRKRRV